MRLTVLLRRQVAWIALCAVTFAGIAPAISQWVASSTGTTWVEICSSAGIKRVALGSDKAPVPVGDHGGTTHCPFCRLQNDLPAAPPFTVTLFRVAEAEDQKPQLPVATPVHTKSAWPPALSRAPPQIS